MRRLEQVVPGLRERLAPQPDLRRISHGSFTRGGSVNMLGRVEVLEDAVEALLAIEVPFPFRTLSLWLSVPTGFWASVFLAPGIKLWKF